MDIYSIFISAVFGLIVGSFLNVLILRYNTGKGIGGRSECLSCKSQLQSVDLVPVFSYLWFRGRCRHCKAKISKQYIVVEIATAALFIAAFLHNEYLLDVSNPIFVIKLTVDCLIMSTLVFMSGYDLRHKIIPDPSVFVFSALALVSNLLIGALTWGLFFAGFLLALPFYLIWRLSGGTWMGLGDAKLAIGIGWLLGLSAGGSAIIFGFWIGAAVSLLIIGLQKLMNIDGLRRKLRALKIPRLTMKSEIPFAPFLIAGLLIVYILGYNLFTFQIL